MARMLPADERPPSLADLAVIESPAQAYDVGYQAGYEAYYANATQVPIHNSGLVLGWDYSWTADTAQLTHCGQFIRTAL